MDNVAEALAYALKDERKVVITERELLSQGLSRPLYIARALRMAGIPAGVDKSGSVVVTHGRLNVSRQRPKFGSSRAARLQTHDPAAFDQVYEWLL